MLRNSRQHTPGYFAQTNWLAEKHDFGQIQSKNSLL